MMATGSSQDEVLKHLRVDAGRPMAKLRKALKDREKREEAVKIQGFNHEGRLCAESRSPTYLRVSRKAKMQVRRAEGAGPESQVSLSNRW